VIPKCSVFALHYLASSPLHDREELLLLASPSSPASKTPLRCTYPRALPSIRRRAVGRPAQLSSAGARACGAPACHRVEAASGGGSWAGSAGRSVACGGESARRSSLAQREDAAAAASPPQAQARPLGELVVDPEVPAAVAAAQEAVGRRRQGPLRLPPRAPARAHPLQPLHRAPHPQLLPRRQHRRFRCAL
jgi:hypothetical protein